RYRNLFTEIMGVSPINYVIDQRMNAAADMLTNTTFPISEISKKVGYEDSYYFSRLFKNRVGVSPVRYRKETVNNI
ncbi:MAG: helix-turn-helix transcriptional regulator, partial [Clostridia bacterium]|nr:helix-turn-helix transcriptional regulator [Clostridia bacterium]